MTTECMNSGESIYRRCRKRAAEFNPTLFSMQETANLLGVELHTLSNYELGVTKCVPPDSVMRMSDLYNSPELTAYYCKHDCPIGRTMNIATEAEEIEGSTLRLLKELNPDEIRKMNQKLIEIAADGEISGDERQELAEIMDKLDDIQYAVSELKLIGKKILNRQK